MAEPTVATSDQENISKIQRNAQANIVVRTLQRNPKISWAALIFVVIVVAAVGTYLLKASRAASCTVSAQMVNSCRPWLGAYVSSYPEAGSGLKSQVTYHEQRIGRQLDVVHDYKPTGDNQLSADDIYYINRANTILMLNWKPADSWASATGSDNSINAGIDQMAQSIKSVAPHKVMLAVFHEPENDVSPGGSPTCGNNITYKGKAGTTTNYVDMWHNVRAHFDAAGVTNVVWVMNYMGFGNWDCMVKDLWPGNNYVDWVVWDPYMTSKTNFTAAVTTFYNYLSNNSDTSHDFLSKAWGLNEWAAQPGVSQSQVYADYAEAKAAIDNNVFPHLKLYDVFDTHNRDGDFRIDYTPGGVKDPAEQAAYNNFADDPHFTDAYYQGSGDNTPPSVTINTPQNNTVVSKTVNISASASDNVAVTAVSLRVDDSFVMVDQTAPYSFSLDTTKYADGPHVITVRAWDAANNYKDAVITLQVNNHDTTPPTVNLISPLNGTTLTGSTVVQATAQDNVQVGKVEFYVDGSLTATASTAPYCLAGHNAAGGCNSWNSTTLTDGSHTILAKAYDEAGNTSSEGITITVANGSLADKTPPVASITAPSDGSTVSGKVLLSASATDNVGVIWMDILVDNVVQASGATDQLSFNWNTNAHGLASGAHTITVEAKDAAGNTGTKSITVYK